MCRLFCCLGRYLKGISGVNGLLCFSGHSFFICKAEEGDVAVATLTDDNAADGNLDKRNIRLIRVNHTRTLRRLQSP